MVSNKTEFQNHCIGRILTTKVDRDLLNKLFFGEEHDKAQNETEAN